MSRGNGRRIVIVQWAGDYRQAVRNLDAGAGEVYYAQRYSVESTASLCEDADEVALICMYSEDVYDERLSNGVRAIGTGLTRGRGLVPVLRTLNRLAPTHLVLHTPEWVFGAWALARGIEFLPVFADSFRRQPISLRRPRQALGSLRQNGRLCALAAVLSSPRVRWVSNHNVPASESLASLGVPASKIVPWDWPPVLTPDSYAPKTSSRDRPWTLAFVGALEPSKGLGDAIEAVSILRRRGRDVRLSIIGRGDEQPHRKRVAALGLDDAVVFHGPQPHANVVRHFESADVSIVPSWHAYPEGLPMTIYESWATRTPLVCSDHPMFLPRVKNDALVYPERDANALAASVERLFDEPGLYESLSERSASAWRRLLCPVRPIELIRRWMRDSEDDRGYLTAQSLAARSPS